MTEDKGVMRRRRSRETGGESVSSSEGTHEWLEDVGDERQRSVDMTVEVIATAVSGHMTTKIDDDLLHTSLLKDCTYLINLLLTSLHSRLRGESQREVVGADAVCEGAGTYRPGRRSTGARLI